MVERVERIGVEATSLVVVIPGRLIVEAARAASPGDCVVLKVTEGETVVIAIADGKMEGGEVCQDG